MNTENINPNLPSQFIQKNNVQSHDVKDLSLLSREPLGEKHIDEEISLECTEFLIPTQLDLELYQLQRSYKQNYREAAQSINAKKLKR